VTVSVIVPAFDAGRFLREALESVFRNACLPLEVIVVDDGSADDTATVAREFPVIVLELPHRGVAAARNAGWARSSGQLIAWLDADDRWPDGKLERQIAVLAANAAVDVVYGKVREFAQDDQVAHWVRPAALARLPGSMLIRREAFARVGAFDEQLAVGEFMDWLVRAREWDLCEAMLDDVCLERRLHGRNLGIVARERRGDYLRVARRALASKLER
jgi:glycosyltransferase involved in cell wall biosynthesis